VAVLGAGVGGLVAAAELVLAGRRPLVLEAGERLGGRFSTIERDGYRLPTGAVAVETVGPFWETFERLGLDPGLRVPDPPVLIRIRGRDVRPGAAVWEQLIKRVTKAAGRLAEGLGRAREEDVEAEITLDAWVRGYTRSKTVRSLFQSLAASIFTVNSDELPASVFFRNLRETGGYKRFGFAPRGNAEIADAIAAAIEARGGEIRRGWTATAVELEDGRAAAVRALGPDGAEATIAAESVVSNLGPLNTAELIAEPTAQAKFERRVSGVQTTSLIALAFSSHEEIVEPPGIWAFTDTERLCNLANLTATCPELAPPGRTLYEAYAVPRPSLGGGFDAAAERRLLEADLERVVPGFREAETVLCKTMRGRLTPAQQCAPGHDLSVRTPVPNLVEVGDGVKPHGWIGTTACAQTARLAVAALERAPEAVAR
jgi:phytoene dehydrogenase-like protein